MGAAMNGHTIETQNMSSNVSSGAALASNVQSDSIDKPSVVQPKSLSVAYLQA